MAIKTRASTLGHESLKRQSGAGLFVVAMIAITGGLFAPILGFGFNLATDDVLFVLQNPLIKDVSMRGLLAVATSPGHVYGEIQPISYISLWTDHALFGMAAWGYYLVQILLHVANVTLVYFFIRFVSGNTLMALATAMIFAIHPLQVDAVAMVNQRKTLLFALFSLFSLLAYLRWETSGARSWYASALSLFILALLSKSSAVVVPLLLVLMKLVPAGGWSQRKSLLGLTPFFLLALLSGLTTIATESAAEQVQALKFGTVLGQLKLILLIYGDYFWSFFLPWNLSPAYIYTAEDLASIRMASAVLFLATALTLIVAGLRRWSWWLTWGMLWFVICLLPTSQLIPTTNLRQDHYMYLAIIGPALIIGGVVHHLTARWEPERLYLPVILAVTLALGPITFLHLEHYSNGLKYCERFEKTQGWIPALESIRGRIFLLLGEYKLAEACYLKTVESFDEPLKSRERFQLAQVYLRMRQKNRAREQLELISPESPLKAEAERMFRDLH
ncbi:MAG: glycosyltransferase family 39 protein [Desulfomonilaceae bacterium]